MYKEICQNQQGAVAIITVIVVSIILTVLTTSFIRITIDEQREATDDDLTTRAYYAAESGVQDAIAALKTGGPSNGADCIPETATSVLSAPEGLDTEYTCQLINEVPSDFQASPAEGKTVNFKLQSASLPIERIVLEWHLKGDASVAVRDGGTADSVNLPQDTNWNSSGVSFPAMLRTQIVEANLASGNVTRTDFESYIGFLNPVNNGSGTVGSLSGLNGLINAPVCNDFAARDEYVCNIEISGLDDTLNDYHLSLTPVYAGTDLKVTAYSSAGVVGLIDAQTVVDVTGRASDVYRRVEERVSKTTFDLWPQYAVLSAETLCKNFAITDLATGGSAANVNFSEANPGTITGSCVTSP